VQEQDLQEVKMRFCGNSCELLGGLRAGEVRHLQLVSKLSFGWKRDGKKKGATTNLQKLFVSNEEGAGMLLTPYLFPHSQSCFFCYQHSTLAHLLFGSAPLPYAGIFANRNTIGKYD
jgi:hypothetical protein